MKATEIGKEIKESLKLREPEISFDLRLSDICTFKIGGVADAVITPNNEETFIRVVEILKRQGIPFIIVGAASDILFSDNGFRGAVIRTHRLNGIMLKNGLLTCSCGVFLPRLCQFAAKNSLGGFHGLCGIPGTVGGSLYTAAGAFGCSIFDSVVSCRIFSPSKNRIIDTSLDFSDFSYRKSPLRQSGDECILLSATFRPPKEENAVILEKIKECHQKRSATQPHGEHSAGSYFKRPYNAPPAAYLIDKAGLKGMTVGGAQVSEKHAGFIINKENATASDVLSLADKIKNRVYSTFGVALSEEVIYVSEK